ncbi:MAG TPA: STAS domain-containing protein [Gammaproteobacteria bacterium]|nr:STAS domain-containing protein [Gammaproteobacteria bacterium]
MNEAVGIVNEEGRLVISGDLNFLTVPMLWKNSLPLLAALPELNFDLKNIRSSNSAGAALLVEWMKYAESSKKKISFNDIPAQLNSIIEALHLNLAPRISA